MKYIAIDIGSTYIKSALLDVEACSVEPIAKLPAPARTRSENPRHFEIPANAFVDMVRTLVAQGVGSAPETAGVLLSTQMHGFVYSIPAREDVRFLAGFALHRSDAGRQKSS